MKPIGSHLVWSVALVSSCVRLVILGLVLACGTSHAAVEPIRLHLKWYHQFQFAGYYAALTKGYYEEAGLEVQLIEGNASRAALKSVLSGEAEFGVGDTDVLLHRMRGDPLVVCAAIFQHSPYIIMSRGDRGIRSPHDLVGKRVMLSEGQGATQFFAMLAREGIDPKQVDIRPHSWDLADLIEGRVDAISAYATVEPARLRRLNVEPAMLRTIDYGVDFYGDTLFTTRALVERDAERVDAFVQASLRGWEYAMAYPEEIISYILTLPGVVDRGVTREILSEEAEAMRAYVLPDIVAIGHMNPERWRVIGQVFGEHRLVSGNVPGDFILETVTPRRGSEWPRLISTISGLVGVLAALVLIWTLQVRRSVDMRTRELREEMARRERVERELLQGKERLKMGQVVGQMGDWSYDYATGCIQWSDTMYRIYGRDPSLGPPELAEVLAVYREEDVVCLQASMRRAAEMGEGYELDLRLRAVDGRETYHHAIARVECGADGRVTRLHGIVQDITARKLIEERVRAQLRELERWREATLGREERVQAMKAEVNELLVAAGRAPRYVAPGSKAASSEVSVSNHPA